MQILQRSALFLLLFAISCKKNEPDPPVETDCRYQYPSNLDNIFGIWEPEQVINLATGDTTNYAKGTGHGGFMLGDVYSDAIELRLDLKYATYYVGSGRFCAARTDGTWTMANDTLYLTRNTNGLVAKLPILALDAETLTVLDQINFNASKVRYRKNNE
ncbi:MAG: hypothetical protein IPL65_16440 [Lewinellaceae bacterium]|nr:hypothetical protein [Lewinellaceae bacterium]